MSWSAFCSSGTNLVPKTTEALNLLNGCSKHHYLNGRQRTNLYQKNHRASKVLAYYGLRSPPYKLDALEPYMSQRTLEMHWGEHHGGYVDALNKQLEKDDLLYGCSLEELIKVTYNNGNPLPEFNNAAQVWKTARVSCRGVQAFFFSFCSSSSSLKSYYWRTMCIHPSPVSLFLLVSVPNMRN